ncbi:MAG: phenylalanyl-tRNA synthetase beta chain [Gammaproteobacteria bacterium]|jgi:phenylalanyl-tRNA synthetase beta chain
MKVSANWLSDWVTTSLDHDELAECLTMAGLEVDSVAPVAHPLGDIWVAKVVTVEPHPNADRLSFCTIDVGRSETVEVVCGAPNVRADLIVAYAAPGAKLPDGREIGAAKVRGVLSAGMLCSAAELDLGEDSGGLLELEKEASVGTLLRDYLELDDVVFDIELTPNRGDCLSIIGVAREVSALTDNAMRKINVDSVAATIDSQFPIEIEQAEACPRYAGRVIRNVDAAVATPRWMAERLRRAGVRCISAVVDITNYVMLELGQPMHGFDLSQLRGGICVRNGRDGESLELLDGQTIELTVDTLVIADGEQAIALAGVMGGMQTGVALTSTDIFLESAYFDSITLAGVARKYRLHTDASHRFERGVDFSGQERAIERASRLILDICGGEAGPISLAQDPACIPIRNGISFRSSEVSRLIGIDLSADRAAGLMRKLGCEVSESATDLIVTPPNFRFDLQIEADILEEIARLIGYAEIPVTLPRTRMSLAPPTTRHERDTLIRLVLSTQGYFEAITYSFTDTASMTLIEPARGAQILSNPISSDMAAMRTTIWPGLIRAAKHNLNRQIDDIRMFELGLIFDNSGGALQQRHVLAGIAIGDAHPEQWAATSRSIDLYDIKQEITKLFEELGIAGYEWSVGDDAALHPGQSAQISISGTKIGKLGVLHPGIASEFDLDNTVIVFELELDKLPDVKTAAYSPISKFPSVRRDVSVVLSGDIAASDVLIAIRKVAGEHLRDLQLFDEYRGQGIDSDKKSLTIGLIFQALSSTLTDEEIEETMKRVQLQLHDDFRGTLRN